MSIFTVPTTSQLIIGTHSLTDFTVNDEISTNGYYAPNDGGGARFRVEQGIAAIDSYFEYTLVNTADKQLKAVMIIEDGTINIDQLGAMGDAVIPDFPEGIIDTAADLSEYMSNIGEANANNLCFDSFFFNVALNNSDIHKICLSNGKKYLFCEKINLSNFSNKIIEGNGATILTCFDQTINNIFYGSTLKNVTIRNITLAMDYFLDTFSCIHFESSENICIENVNVVFGGSGIRISDSTCVNIKNVSFSHCFSGLYMESVTDSKVSGVTYTAQMNVPDYESEPVYIGSGIERCIIENVFVDGSNIVDTGIIFEGTATDYLSNNLFSYLYAKKCVNALSLSFVKESSFEHICMTNSATAISVENVSDLRFKDCLFKDIDSNTVIPLFKLGNGVCEKLIFNDCLFDASKTLFFVVDREVNDEDITGDDIIFADCKFKIGNFSTKTTMPIAYIANPISSIRFIGCNFVVESFAKESEGDTDFNNLTENAYIFYLRNSSDEKNFWEFDSCSFSHNTEDTNSNRITVTSPILINYEDESNTFVKLTNNTFKGFRWITRICTSTETSAVPCKDEEGNIVSQTGDVKINPAFGGYPDSDIIEEAQRLFAEKQRYLSYDNRYLFDTLTPGVNTTYYKKAEEYGLS